MKIKKRNKAIILLSIITIILLIVVGITYAVYANLITGTTQKLVLGDIYMHYTETNTLTLNNAMPSGTYDSTKYFEFTVDGKNNYQNNDIYYEILLSHGNNHATRTERIKDNLLKFTLVEIKNNQEKVVVDGMSFDEINNTRIWVNTIPKNTLSQVNTTYRLYMWISNETKIGNTSDVDYDMNTWNNQVYASIKINVNGDFDEKSMGGNTAADLIISKYGTETNLVAVNTDGTLYTGSGEIREYRYSGPTANNYVIFNDDGDSEVEANELWRIVGVFKNSEDKWNLKLMRDNMLGSSELVDTYILNAQEYWLDYWGTGDIAWGDNNNWTISGIQYYLNTNQDDNGVTGYYSKFTTTAKKLIDENYKYYLGNVYFSSKTKDVYNAEREITICENNITSNTHNNDCNVWSENFPSWNGAIGLLYPSDYGYSVNSSYWIATTLDKYDIAANKTSWIHQTANKVNDEWFLSPSSDSPSNVLYFGMDGKTNFTNSSEFYEYYIGIGARPVLNLISEATMEDALGTIDNPYRIIEE